MFDKFANMFDRTLRNLSEAFGSPIHSYCRLETVDEDGNLVADDGSLISIVKLEGGLKHIGADEYVRIISGLTEKLNSVLSQPGHSIQVVFEFDPESSSQKLDSLFMPSRNTAKNLGLDIDELFNSWSDSLKKYCAIETCYFVLWTRPEVLAKSVRKRAVNERNAQTLTVPNLQYSQQVCRGITAIKDIHAGFVSGVIDTFKQLDLLAHSLSARESLQEIRMCIDPYITSSSWSPLIPGDPLPAREPNPDSSARNLLENVVYPDFKTQLWAREGELVSHTAMKIGDRIYSPFIITMMPQTPKPFQELFRVLSRKEDKIPYRISFLIESGGLEFGFKSVLSSLLSFTSSANKKLNNAIEQLKQLELAGTCCVKFKICMCTWVDLQRENQDSAEILIRRRVSELAKAVQGWGTCDVTELIGDPLYGISATLPAIMPTSPAPSTAAPLQEAISMLPFRSASPWKEGSLIFRTQDGKIIPFAPNSSEQAAWIDLGVAPMGGGKSVFLNAFNFAFITQAGVSRLPWVSIIDVGPSSSGLITLIKESLPSHQKHLAAYHRLRMTPDFAINPFDLPLGNRKPLPSHTAFLLNLLSLFATPLDTNAPADGVPGLLHRAIDLAYEDLADGNHPRIYQANALPELHVLVINLNIKIDISTTWWEIVDALFKVGHIHEAIQAQRYAVPLLADISAQINQNSGILNTYTEKTRLQVWRSLIDVIETYVILKEPTQFDLGDAQIVSLDLDEVAPRGGATADRQAAVMYMLARHILGTRFFLMPEDVKLMPELYQDYHAKRIEAIREDPKRLCYDEAHRVTKNHAVAGQLQNDLSTMARESRKWNLSIGLYTQSIEDLPDIIIELATTISILGSGTKESIRVLQQRFGLNGACTFALERLGKPGAGGANFIGLFRTGSGFSQLVLTLTISSHALWAFSTTTEDVAIRNKLYQIMSPTETLKRLAMKFPSGSAKSEIERRKRLVEEHLSDEYIVNVIDEIVLELQQNKGD